MLVELLGKGGNVCQMAQEGKVRCPLIVRPTSEDVITGQMFQALDLISPRWWLPQLLNAALGITRFRQQVYRRLRIELWKNRSPYPRDLLPWNEGSTQVDVTITWENPPTTVFIEMKYGSELSSKTVGDSGSHGFPSDQLIRNIRVGLHECGWFEREQLFAVHPRNFVVVVLGPTGGYAAVAKYRNHDAIKAAIPHAEKLIGLPTSPFVGEIGYEGVTAILTRNRAWMSRPERKCVDTMIDYLGMKLAKRSREAVNAPRQSDLQLA